MDTTETYGKMCDCEEIQKNHFDFIGIIRLAALKEKITEGVQVFEVMGKVYSNVGEKIVWLPRQDQLQEMMNDCPEYPKGIINKLYAFADFVHRKPYLPRRFKDIEKDEACHFFNSMEQLWLAFMMKGKYNKIWDGENWVHK